MMKKILLSLLLASSVHGGAAEKPNVILINADDLGLGLLGCYGQELITTPHIDRLAAEGMKFNNYYGGTLCAPSRWSLLTGMNFAREGAWDYNFSGLLMQMDKKKVPEEQYMKQLNDFVAESSVPIPEHEVFLGQLAQQAGYKTAQFGKLDVGFLTNHERVQRFGWDHYLGYYSHSRAHGFYPPYMWQDGKRVFYEGNELVNCGKMSEKGDEPVGSGGKVYSQNEFLKGILSFMETNKDNPFFIYHSTQLPHGPVAIPELHPDYADQAGWSLAEKKFASMVKMLDDHVGVIMAKLDELGLAENTVVFFTSDNGHELYYGPKSSFPKKMKGKPANLTDRKWRTSEAGDLFNGAAGLAGMKRAIYEGGVLCPMIVHWPGKVKASTETEHLSTHYDFMATMADIMGISVPRGKDSISYLPTLVGSGVQAQHDFIPFDNRFTRMGRTGLVTHDGWKVLEVDREKDAFQLYDLNQDPEERKDLSAQYPEKLEKWKKVLLEQLKSARPDLAVTK